MRSLAIDIKNVSKSFDNGLTRAARSLSLTVEEGEFLALVGGSGELLVLDAPRALVGHENAYVRELFEAPLRQAAGLQARLAEAGRGG